MIFPCGGSVLALHPSRLFNTTGMSTLGPDGLYNLDGEARIQRILAPLLMAAAVWLIFRTALLAGLPVSWALVIALGTALEARCGQPHRGRCGR